ncbi:MAG: peptidoglycan-binding domain-containing protein [Candidatus Paceibacterota bacterium]
MERRKIKQILYGAGYLAVIFLIVAGVYLIWLKPAPTCFDGRKNQGEIEVDCGEPCAPCEIKTLQPLEMSWVRDFSVGDKTVIAAEIKNLNSDYGADSFSYTFDVYNFIGEKIYTLTDNSFIYASEIKYLFEADIDKKDIDKIELSFSNVNWKSQEEFPKPEIQTREIKTESAKSINVSGLVINNNAFELSKVNIISFLFNRNGLRIGASKTELDNLQAFEEKFFRIIFPKYIILITETPASTAYNFINNLTIGSKGEDVRSLQKFLKDAGFFNRETTDYFGLITKNALIQYQKQEGISPTSGYFGPKTRAHINSLAPPLPMPKFNLNEADPNLTKVYVEAIR